MCILSWLSGFIYGEESDTSSVSTSTDDSDASDKCTSEKDEDSSDEFDVSANGGIKKSVVKEFTKSAKARRAKTSETFRRIAFVNYRLDVKLAKKRNGG